MYQDFILLKGYLENLDKSLFDKIPELRTVQVKCDEMIEYFEESDDGLSIDDEGYYD